MCLTKATSRPVQHDAPNDSVRIWLSDKEEPLHPTIGSKELSDVFLETILDQYLLAPLQKDTNDSEKSA